MVIRCEWLDVRQRVLHAMLHITLSNTMSHCKSDFACMEKVMQIAEAHITVVNIDKALTSQFL